MRLKIISKETTTGNSLLGYGRLRQSLSRTGTQVGLGAQRILYLVKGEVFSKCEIDSTPGMARPDIQNPDNGNDRIEKISKSAITNTQCYLGQNNPNPMKGNGTVSYRVPEKEPAKILFYDIFGKCLKEYNLNVSEGTLEISMDNLPPGIYLYKLIVQGQIVRSRSMIISN